MKLIRIIICVIAILVFMFAISVWICSCSLKSTEYDVQVDGIETPARIVCISDLPGKEYGRDNTRLIDKIDLQHPDAIFVVGDMINSDADETEVESMLELLIKLQNIAPVYFSPGNHELEYVARTDDGLLQSVTATGAVPLNDSYVEADIGGNTVRIGGTMGHGFPFGRTTEEFEASDEYAFLKQLEDTELPTVCLAHMPDTIIFNNAQQYWNTDLFISGHTHGGVIRIPGIGGMYAPMQGWWPEYDYGYYTLGEHIQLIITSGLSGYEWVPRVFNRPEICVITLQNNR